MNIMGQYHRHLVISNLRHPHFYFVGNWVWSLKKLLQYLYQ